MTQLALINTTTSEILSTHTAGHGRVQVPGESVVVSPPEAGWTHGDYALVPIVPHYPAPEGQQVASVTRAIVDGQVVETATYEAVPEVVRQIAKSVVQQRIIDAGLIDAAYAALTANPAHFARWFAPDHPVLNVDDPDALALLQAIGADPDEILAA